MIEPIVIPTGPSPRTTRRRIKEDLPELGNLPPTVPKLQTRYVFPDISGPDVTYLVMDCGADTVDPFSSPGEIAFANAIRDENGLTTKLLSQSGPYELSE